MCEQEWIALVRSIAAADPVALRALYERARSPVFTLVLRISQSRETAEEITVDVFHEVWRRAAAYDPANGSVIGWIMNIAHSRAIDRLRFERRQKRATPDGEGPPATQPESPQATLAREELRALLNGAVARLTVDERQAIEAAFFGESSYSEVAAQLNQPLGTVKTRIRSGLAKLRDVLGPENEQ